MDESIIVVLRMLERLLVVSFGGMSIYLGYKLFFHLPYKADHEGKLELLGMKVVLSRVAPGIFFLAFGAVVLLYNLNKGITQTTNHDAVADLSTGKVSTFAGANNLSGNTDSAGALPRRHAVIEQIGELNCLMKKAKENKLEISPSIRIAHNSAKIALIKQVWTPAWGDMKALELEENSIENKLLRSVFSDVSISCE